MSKKIGGVVALVSMCALSLFLLDCGSSSSRPSGVLYVLTEGNNDIGNNVSSFALDLRYREPVAGQFQREHVPYSSESDQYRTVRTSPGYPA